MGGTFESLTATRITLHHSSFTPQEAIHVDASWGESAASDWAGTDQVVSLITVSVLLQLVKPIDVPEASLR